MSSMYRKSRLPVALSSSVDSAVGVRSKMVERYKPLRRTGSGLYFHPFLHFSGLCHRWSNTNEPLEAKKILTQTNQKMSPIGIGEGLVYHSIAFSIITLEPCDWKDGAGRLPELLGVGVRKGHRLRERRLGLSGSAYARIHTKIKALQSKLVRLRRGA